MTNLAQTKGFCESDLKKINTKLNIKQRRANNVIFTLVYISLIRIFLFYSFFNEFSTIEILFDPLSALVALFGLFVVRDSISKPIKYSWIGMIVFMLIAYLNHPSAATHLCNLITELGVLTLLPQADIKHSQVKPALVIYFLYVILVLLFAPKFSEDDAGGIININTNLSSTILLCGFVILISRMLYTKKGRGIILLFCIGLIYEIFSFRGRSAIISVLLVCLYLIGRKLFNRIRSQTIGIVVFILSIGSVLFAYIYSTILWEAVGGNATIFGKNLFTGRQSIWGAVFERFDDIWLLGYGNRFDVGYDYLPSMHNVMMGLIVDFGCIATLFYVALLSKLMSKFGKILDNKILVFFVFVLLIKTVFEADFISDWTVSHLCIAYVFVYVFSKPKDGTRQKDKGEKNNGNA